MTKEEIANIKRIDTSLNVFKKKISAIDAKIKKLTEPLIEEQKNLKAEIDFWERPVIDRYGKTTEELLKEAGEETAEETSAEEEAEEVKAPEENLTEEPEQENEPENTEGPEVSDELSNNELANEGLNYQEFPKEWED